MTIAEAINRACDEACKIERQQRELCGWLEELKAYKETGLTPEEVTALQASNQELKKEALPILQAKVQDRLVILPPIKVGDDVWVNDNCVRDWSVEPLPYKCRVFGIEITEKEKRFYVECYKTGRVFPFDFNQAGKTVFLTREEAEAALKEREG